MPPTPAPISNTTAEPTALSTALDIPSTPAPIFATTTPEPTALSTEPEGTPSPTRTIAPSPSSDGRSTSAGGRCRRHCGRGGGDSSDGGLHVAPTIREEKGRRPTAR
ncbi:hypothetical protein Esi_0016_0174 [Ectocarpus siliculosus]|uniref:Uncharacterized protein n=1 Tax=Ectocarpus siliculosus TaxID=2880 RepID=D7FLN4_ECTSI|nr:hypothetical protein Esi_0016_0174 [Ectocarpus siliculosus]|eukprot:CBJ25850.1 hypothetical protein Esi_0016_0174 [Ectocarpus siliculosus]